MPKSRWVPAIPAHQDRRSVPCQHALILRQFPISLARKPRMIPDALLAEAETPLAACRAKGVMLATAESCTGGLIAAMLTAIAGSFDVVDRGFVTCSDEAKNELIGVPMPLIQTRGAVSEEVARAMAEGALARSRATIAVSVTGVAGPGGGTSEKPVGLMCFGLTKKLQPVISERHILPGERAGIRAAAVAHAFTMIRAQV
jgi:nicotinamide-nucleotide amidase